MNILIIGESGSGKSSSLINLDWNKTFLIKSVEKPLPYKNNLVRHTPGNAPRGNYMIVKDINDLYPLILQMEQKYPEIDTLIIDDFQYYLSKPFVIGMNQLPKGTKVYDMMTTIQTNVGIFLFNLEEHMANSNLNIYILIHSDTQVDGFVKSKTLGKLLDEKMTIEGLFTLVLHSKKVEKDNKLQYVLYTKELNSVVKSPRGMFEEEYIPNDINLVNESIKKYYQE